MGKRPLFAWEHKDWTLKQWEKVMWLDESRFFPVLMVMGS